ncbi:hypothetical protein HBDW_10500 [Herbaspirillum sp. DW155]|uniref:hypothetical protein n=1 Tax=Herbaspirillum sp. DW155 TaxID=3095609 RepID=UPI00308D540D|nr:hypothetical protein HBDW_10500 [Herbaspirillum sp. DW155]
MTASHPTAPHVQIVSSAAGHESRAEFLARMQTLYVDELHQFDEIPADKMEEAGQLYEAFRTLTADLERDSAKVTLAQINDVMTLAESYFGVNWKKDTRLSGYAYQFVSHPSAVLGIIPSTISAHSKKVSTELVATGFSTQLLYALTAFMPMTFMHSMVFQGQFRLAARSTKIASDSVKTPTLAASLKELQEAAAEFERTALAMQEPDAQHGDLQDVIRNFSDAYNRLLDARANCAKVEAKFNIEQNALYNTTLVRGARAIVSMAASVTSLSTRNAPLGLIILSTGTLMTMLAQICAGLADTSQKASAQNRLMPRAVNVLQKAEQELMRSTASPAEVQTVDQPEHPRPAEIEQIAAIARSPEDITPATTNSELSTFIKTLGTMSLTGPFEMRVSLLERRFDLDKRMAMQDLAELYDMPDCDSYMRLQYLTNKIDQLSEEERAEHDVLAGQYAVSLPQARQQKADACRALIERVDADVAALKQPDWNALSDIGKDALTKELEAYIELQQYKDLRDIRHLLPTVFRAVHDGILDLTKPEQLTPLAINKCVQVFTMLLGGPAIPQLVSASLSLFKKLYSNDHPGFQFPRAIVAAPLVVALFSIYGSRFGPYASTHTVQLRSDLKNKLAQGLLNIPAGARMYRSKQFWKLFMNELPGSVVAQGMIAWGLRKISGEYKKSDQLLETYGASVQEHLQAQDVESGARQAMQIGASASPA